MNWRCLPCGKLVPLTWLVCPFCRKPKDSDGQVYGDDR